MRGIRFIIQPPAPTPLVIHDTIPGNEEISETGVLKQVDDAGYPMVTLTIEWPKQKRTEQFILNLEDIRTVPLATLSGLVGQSVSFRYTTEQTNALLDIEVGGRFLLDADAGVITNETSKVTGVLGADEITTGDVPGLLMITATDGEITEFPFFITSELLEVNGSVVTAFYEERTTNTITAITITK
ncbi:hypothetical protein [Fibrella forsythiae]|uniref:Cohesin domain-containing protein n=1 Tax=Fibrella forsythiae TaxID=2817061 RepID=A0ABS3JS44_9BACT|nr:hypothetical protein [Fibrella forsythiae]MBO0952824.1 hypothetical protein [Fibrella forsythiae]